MTLTVIYTGLHVPETRWDHSGSIELLHFPTIRILYEHPDDFTPVEMFLCRNPYVVFLSQNGVIGLDRWLQDEHKTFPSQRGLVLAVGNSTARKVLEKFGVIALQPISQNSKGLVETFSTIAKRPALIFGAKHLLPLFPDWLAENKWEYMQVSVYRTSLIVNDALGHHFKNSPEEYVFFTSPSTVKGFLKSIAQKDFGKIKSRLVSIGPTTTAEVRSSNGQVFWEARKPDITRSFEELVINL